MYWLVPPSSYAELMLWRCFVECEKEKVYGIVWKWIKKYGNPFDGEMLEDEDKQRIRHYFQESIKITYTNKI